MSISIIILLVVTGIFVGVINTFAGAAAAISITVYTALGLPIGTANGTNRISVMFQTLVMSLNFRQQGVLDYRVGMRLGIPTVIGAIIGAQTASVINPSIFVWILVTILILLLMMLIFSPKKLFSPSCTERRELRWMDYVWFLLIGIYGGAFHIGVGYVILSVTILAMGYDVIAANALKGFIVMLYTPVALAIFIYHRQVDFTYGMIHASGNVIGAWLASHYATRISSALIRWTLVALVVVTLLDLLKIISIQTALNSIIIL